MAKKEYKLEIDYLYDTDNWDVLEYFSKGHHDKDTFVAKVKDEEEKEIDPALVVHRLARWTPCWVDGERQGMTLIEVKKYGSGAFPVTLSKDFYTL